MLFTVGGQEFEDYRIPIDIEEWNRLKPTFPFHQVPVLDIEENSQTRRVAQSGTIIRLLANRFNLAGEDEFQRVNADMAYEEMIELWDFLYRIYRKPNGEEKTQELETAFSTRVPEILKFIQNILEANRDGNGYIAGKSLTYADLYLINLYDWLSTNKHNLLEKFPLLKEHEAKIRNLPKVAEHLNKNAHVRVSTMF